MNSNTDKCKNLHFGTRNVNQEYKMNDKPL